MHKGYMIILLLIIYIHGSTSNYQPVYYICNGTDCNQVVQYDCWESCNKEDNMKNVSFVIPEDESSPPLGRLHLQFSYPKSNCCITLRLLANASVNEDECMNYSFINSMQSEKHTDRSVWFFPNKQQHGMVKLEFKYIFTGCYQFIFFDESYNPLLQKNTFLRTNYTRTKITKPKDVCFFHVEPYNKSLTKLQLNLSVPIVNEIKLLLGVYRNNPAKCATADAVTNEKIWSFYSENYAKSKSSNSSTKLAVNETYLISKNFIEKTLENKSYCFVIKYFDLRCESQTLWATSITCQWSTHCKCLANCHKEDDDTRLSSPLPHIISVVVTMLVIICMGLCICTFKLRKRFREIVLPNSNFGSSQFSEEEENYKNIYAMKTNIVLLYPKGSESFMRFMAYFREMLTRVCHCIVHDWYDGMEWNSVAKIGGSDWFAGMLYKESRVVWIDVPAMRSLITRRSKEGDTVHFGKETNCVGIGDFRDVSLPAVFNLAKRHVEESLERQQKHFIIKLKEFEYSKSETDPFVCLSSRRRYLIPQDLVLLCCDLSSLELDVIAPFIQQEEDLFLQHLHNLEHDCFS